MLRSRWAAPLASHSRLPINVPVTPARGGRAVGVTPPVPMAVVPNLVGATEEKARDLLIGAGLKVGEVAQAEANAKPLTVYKQDYAAGAQVTVGTAVGFVVAAPVTPPPVKLMVVPDLGGATEEKARELLVNAGLSVGEVTKAEADARPFTVFKQSYAAGAQVTAGTVVGFVLAVPITVSVPSVVGNTESGAVTILRNVNLRAGTIKGEQSRLPKGQILTQSIPAGTKVPAGSPVDLTVAVPITLPVPPLRLLSQLDAVALLKKHELAVGDVTTEESREFPGTVLSQRPTAGTIVELGTRVSFVVAMPITVAVPSLVNRSQADALALLKKLELTVGSVTSDESRAAPETVLSQVPAAGTKVTIGTAVAFVTARPMTVLVPNVVSLQEADARKVLLAKELRIGSTRAEEARVSPGSVVRQSIAVDTRVILGTAIDLVTAKPIRSVPGITGLKEEAAQRRVVFELKNLAGGIRNFRSSQVTF